MPDISSIGFDATIRHAVMLEQLKAGQAKTLLPFLRQIDEALRLRLSTGELTTYSRVRLEKLLGAVDENVRGIVRKFEGDFTKELKALATAESKFEAASLTEQVQNKLFEATIPAPKQVWASALANPLSVRGVAGGQLLDGFIRHWGDAQVDSMVNRIRRGVFEGETNGSILRGIRGTVGGGFREGILGQTYRQSQAMVRTSVQHISHQARLATLQANDDLVKGYQWVSTLDNRTSEICQALSGEVFKLNEGPVPPAHINCRSTIVPVLDERFDFLKKGRTQSSQFGPVNQNETYFSWIKQQPASFQDQVLGPVKAKLLRDGGLSVEEFQRLVRADNYTPITLARMQQLAPLAFEKAGIRITDSGRAVIGSATKPRGGTGGTAGGTAPPPAPTPAPAAPAVPRKVGAVTEPPEPWNLGGSKAKLTNNSLTQVLRDLGTPEAAALVDFLNRSKVGMMYGESTKFGSRSWRIRVGKKAGRDQWQEYQRSTNRSPANSYQTEPWARDIDSAGGYTSKTRNYVVILDHAARGKPLADLLGLNIAKLKAALKGSFTRVHKPKYAKELDRMPGLEDKPFTVAHDVSNVYGVGAEADTFLTWIHEIGHQIDYRVRYTAHRAGGNYWKPWELPDDIVKVSGYAHANDLEWFAETFTAWVVDREALLAIDPRAVRIIDEAVATALKFDEKPF